MSETAANQKNTPGRRRQPRNNGRAAAQKAYASENDMGAVDPSRYHMSPQTPEKNGAGSAATNNSRAANGRQRAKNNKPAKQKNAASTSPEPDQPPQATPQRPTSIKATNKMAFAGATFHASPAPSALPMPSFFKGNGGSPAAKDVQNPVQQPSPPATDTDIPTPQRQSVGTRSSDSPLDFMFKAHREEKERQRQGSHPGAPSNGTPPTHSPFGNGAFTKAASVPHTRPMPVRHASSGAIDSDELGRSFGQPTGPAFSTPYQERIKAARTSNGRTYAGQQSFQQASPSKPAEDPTEALKRFLFGGNAQSPGSTSSSRPAMAELPASPSAPRTHEVRPPQNNPGTNIQAMENDLRRILKLDSAPSAERRLFSG